MSTFFLPPVAEPFAAVPKKRYLLATIGFSYRDWRRSFYAAKLPPDRWLAFYATRFEAVEINTSFYAVPSPDLIQHWCRSVPETFRFAVKVHQFVTHDVKLRKAVQPMRKFIAALQPFGERLGPVLIQLAPWRTTEEMPEFRRFIAALPPGPRYAVEFRSSDWLCEETYRLLKEHRVALVGADHEDHPQQARVQATTDFFYVRLVGKHGRFLEPGREMYDPTEQLRVWLDRLRAAEAEAGGRETWVTCSNDFAGHAPATLRRFAALAGVRLPIGEQQRTLF